MAIGCSIFFFTRPEATASDVAASVAQGSYACLSLIGAFTTVVECADACSEVAGLSNRMGYLIQWLTSRRSRSRSRCAHDSDGNTEGQLRRQGQGGAPWQGLEVESQVACESSRRSMQSVLGAAWTWVALGIGFGKRGIGYDTLMRSAGEDADERKSGVAQGLIQCLSSREPLLGDGGGIDMDMDGCGGQTHRVRMEGDQNSTSDRTPPLHMEAGPWVWRPPIGETEVT